MPEPKWATDKAAEIVELFGGRDKHVAESHAVVSIVCLEGGIAKALVETRRAAIEEATARDKAARELAGAFTESVAAHKAHPAGDPRRKLAARRLVNAGRAYRALIAAD